MANPNDWIDEDNHPGLPVGRVGVRENPRGHASPGPDLDDAELRPGETELGRPPQVPRNLAPLTDEDRRRLRQAEEEQAARELAEAEELIASDPAVFRWAGVFAHPLAVSSLVGMIGVLGLFVYSQAVGVLNALASQPDWVRYTGYAGLALVSLCVLYAVVRMAVLYLKLRRNRQIRLAGLQELANRTRLRWLSHAKSAEAKTQLEDYLRTFPLESDRQRRSLERVGVTPALSADLRLARDELLDPARFASSDEWFRRFRADYQSKLDAAAEARIKYWANRAMLVTALAPNGLYDSLATTYFGFAMIGDLCRIYNLRAGKTGTAVLLTRVFFNAYLAGNVGDWEKLAEDQYDHLFNQAFSIVGVGVSGNVVGKVLGKVGAKATTGYLNRVLLSRLGRYACRLLRPVSQE